MAKKILFIDRDGTLIKEPADFQIDSLEKLEFYPGVFSGLSVIAQELDFTLVMVTNQDGLGTPSFPETAFFPVQEKVITAFKNEGVVFFEVLIDRSFPEENLPTRKPGTAMLQHYLNAAYDIANSFVIGDRVTDLMLAKNLGCKSIFLNAAKDPDAALCTSSWKDIYHFLKKQQRKAFVKRQTAETNIETSVNLTGTGQSNIRTGIGFFDHMLEQIARHGGLDLSVQVTGDLHVDEHHTVEDVAITLGQAFAKALENKTGIQRYGFTLPMDDALAQVALDFGGRPWIVWEATFKREMIGSMPTELFFHFFKSFTDHAKCNLNIKAEGTNEHHKIESIFKAFAKSVKMAVADTGDAGIPSTKGVL